jgi:hypothetical protein
MTPHPQRDWVDYAIALGPLLAVLVAIGVAGLQAYWQHQNYKQQLFDKRLCVYEATGMFLFRIRCFRNEYLVKDLVRDHRTFLHETASAKFLFGSEVPVLLDELSDKVALQSIKTYPIAELVEFCYHYERRVESAFAPYLYLPDVSAFRSLATSVNK